jgi:Fe-S-cluster containining protein
MVERVERPLWRRFAVGEEAAAKRHAKAGGISVIAGRHWHLYGELGPRDEPEPPLFVHWAIMAIEAARWGEVTEGPMRGLARAWIAPHWRERVQEWIDRDLAFDGATQTTPFDCMKCGACCMDNRVVLDEEDQARLRSSNDKKIYGRVRRYAGLVLLPLVRSGHKPCVHLHDLKCGIYPFRPNMCRDFPAGTEQCMTSREDVYQTPFPEGR